MAALTTTDHSHEVVTEVSAAATERHRANVMTVVMVISAITLKEVIAKTRTQLEAIGC